MNINSISFKSTPMLDNNQAREYNDPLLKWPLRGAAFTNEIGEGLRPMIGSAANLFWIPVFLYIGADVYDKYKNDKDIYNPEGARALKQTCFQLLASVMLPILAIKAGQNIFSLFGLAGKDKLTCNAQNNIADLAKTFVANGNMRAYEKSDAECINRFKDIVKNNLEFKKNKNFITKFFSKIQADLKINTSENLEAFADKTIKDLIKTRKLLLNPTQEFKENKLYFNYKAALERGETKSVASKSVLIKMLNNNTLKSRLIKTIGGFIAVGFAINPTDKFVEHVVVEKYLSPKIDKLKHNSEV